MMNGNMWIAIGVVCLLIGAFGAYALQHGFYLKSKHKPEASKTVAGDEVGRDKITVGRDYVKVEKVEIYPPKGAGQPESTKTNEKNNVLQKLPLFDFIVKKQAQDPERKYVDEILSITNKGEGPAENVTIIKGPLPDNKQKVAVSGQQKRINEAFTKKLLLVGVNDTPHFLFRERGYAGKNVRITVMFRKSNDLFQFIYEGELSKLRLVSRSFHNKETGQTEEF